MYRLWQHGKYFEWSTDRHGAAKRQVGLGSFESDNEVRAFWNFHNGKQGEIKDAKGKLVFEGATCVKIEWSDKETFLRPKQIE